MKIEFVEVWKYYPLTHSFYVKLGGENG